ncbi:hypothetical protein [Brevibacillus parabrevis]|uniref:hypothetical protein n=1 Tax=Brevibacillus parabrevis TaxID=54914 RepID=UPI001F620F3A|nr:hypothetical protein [Brevibacillus parabrevis]MDR4997648.1 hypothetical protein [Brevibacillus parabrevis]
MKKKLAMSVMALAVSAMAGSAFAADHSTAAQQAQATFPTKVITLQNDGSQVMMQQVIDLNQLAKEKGITVEELIKQFEKEGQITKATPTKVAVKEMKNLTANLKIVETGDATQAVATTVALDLNEVAKERGITVEQLKAELENSGKTKADLKMVTIQPAINLEQLAKEKGITVDELIKQLEKEGKLTKAVKIMPAVKK